MSRLTCPFAPALFGSITGSAAGAVSGAISGWMLYALYATLGGTDASGVAFLVFGTLGMGIGGSGGAVGGMVEGWSLGEGKGPAEISAANWGAALGGLWGLQPILWLAYQSGPGDVLRFGLGITFVVVALGAIAGRLGGLAARQVARAFDLVRAPAVPEPGRSHRAGFACIMERPRTIGDEARPLE